MGFSSNPPLPLRRWLVENPPPYRGCPRKCLCSLTSTTFSMSLSLHVIMATIFRSQRASKPQLWEEGEREGGNGVSQAIHEGEDPVEVVRGVEGSLQPALTTPPGWGPREPPQHKRRLVVGGYPTPATNYSGLGFPVISKVVIEPSIKCLSMVYLNRKIKSNLVPYI